jgi:hypothetical protein
MGTFAETASIDYRYHHLPTRKQTPVFRFLLEQTNESLPFPFSAGSKQTEVAVFH